MQLSQSATQFNVERDLRTAEAMAARLKPYVYEPELYGLMPGDLPRLTVGGMLMRVARLSALHLPPEQAEALKKTREQIEGVRTEWRVAYEGKIQREFKARLMSMNQFLDECPENPRNCGDHFPGAVEKRVMLEALKDEAESLDIFSKEMSGGLTALDNKIHRYFEKGDNFIWDSKLEPAYPDDKYWFLYSVSSRD